MNGTFTPSFWVGVALVLFTLEKFKSPELAGLVTGEEVVDAVVLLGDEEGEALLLAGEGKLELHLVAACHGLEACLDFLFFERELLQAPLEAHEEGILLLVDVLLEVDDVPLMGGDEAGDIMDEARTVRAVDEEGGGFGHAQG
mgnify:CR=1 FL=1